MYTHEDERRDLIFPKCPDCDVRVFRGPVHHCERCDNLFKMDNDIWGTKIGKQSDYVSREVVIRNMKTRFFGNKVSDEDPQWKLFCDIMDSLPPMDIF